MVTADIIIVAMIVHLLTNPFLVIFRRAHSKGEHNIYQLTASSSLRRRADQGHLSQENLLDSHGPTPYVTIKNSSVKDSSNTELNLSTVSVKELFDDGIYGEGYVPPPVRTSPESSRTPSPYQRPPATEEVIILPGGKVVLTGNTGSASAKRSSLERFAGGLVKVSSLKRRTASQDNLIDDDDENDYDHLCKEGDNRGDYEDVIINKMAAHDHSDKAPPPRLGSSNQSHRQANRVTGDQSNARYRDEEIYGNLLYTKDGAMGNAGERWESYWKTQTLLRTKDQSGGKKEKK